MDWGDDNSRLLGLESEGTARLLDQIENGIETVYYQNSLSNNVKWEC